MNKEQITALQRGDGPSRPGLDWNGKPLVVDGDWGPRTAWWAGIKTLPEDRETLIRELLSHNGKKEDDDRPNRSTWIDEIQRPGGVGVGNPWCAAFVSHCLKQTGAFPDWPYHMKVAYMIEWAKRNGLITQSPLPGDIHAFLYNVNDKESPGHTGFYLAGDANWIVCCDGNAGNAVRVGKRARQGLIFIRTVPDSREVLAMPPLKELANLDGSRAATR